MRTHCKRPTQLGAGLIRVSILSIARHRCALYAYTAFTEIALEGFNPLDSEASVRTAGGSGAEYYLQIGFQSSR